MLQNVQEEFVFSHIPLDDYVTLLQNFFEHIPYAGQNWPDNSNLRCCE